jgi:hypothetical protein
MTLTYNPELALNVKYSFVVPYKRGDQVYYVTDTLHNSDGWIGSGVPTGFQQEDIIGDNTSISLKIRITNTSQYTWDVSELAVVHVICAGVGSLKMLELESRIYALEHP